ncbi:MAG: hypothetical protein GY861_25885 [bacterium]|nr:hypothetical protein [bacterium]
MQDSGEASDEKQEKPKRYEMCYVDADTFVVRAAKLMQEDYIEVKHISSGRSLEFRNRTSFGVRSGKIIELTEDEILSDLREKQIEINGKKVKVPYKWLAWKNYDQEKKGSTTFRVEDFEIFDKARLNSEFDTYEKALKTAEMIFASDIKGIKTHMDSEDYTLSISSGNGNYRDYESKTVGYKSKRGDKPIYFQEFKDSVADTYKNKIWWTDNEEAEDHLQYVAKQQEALYGEDRSKWTVCGAYCDKDLHQIYLCTKNFDKYEEGWRVPSKFECEKTLVAQAISGDPTDTIEGLPTLTEATTKHFGLRKAKGVSKATAEKLLDGSGSIQEMWKRAIFCYQQYYGFDKSYQFKDVHGEEQNWTWLDYMQQCYVLVKMREYHGETPCVRKYLSKIGVDYTEEIKYGAATIDTDSLTKNLEVCKGTLENLNKELKSYKSLSKPLLVEKVDGVKKLVDELNGNMSLLEK